MEVDTNIKLTPDEQELFNIIEKVVREYAPSTQVFAVGGWTRDKLLGVDSNDIDLMVSNMAGEDFAKLITEYMGIKDPNVIKENPEASKHITTAKAYIPLSSGTMQEVDFAQARQEVYSDDSRIPNLQPASPEEDAYRRDLTINSLFYDIVDKKVIDFTGKGIKDLLTMTIRTPEDPVKTFEDDPLRIFRTIRFAAKYNGKIDPETYSAMENPKLRELIKQKVSKERISEEIEKMLKYPNSEMAIQLLKNTGILEDVINESIVGTQYEGKMMPFEMDQSNPHHELSVWGHTLETITNTLKNFAEDDPEKRALLTLAALFHDIGKLYSGIHKPRFDKNDGNETPREYVDPATNEKKQVVSYPGHEVESAVLAPLVMKYLKFSNKKIKEVQKLVESHMKMHEYTRDKTRSDAEFRKLIRELTEIGIEYTDMFRFTLADAYSKKKGEVDPETIATYNELSKRLEEVRATMGEKDNILSPVLSGSDIMEAFKDKNGIPKKAGAWMKEVTNFTKTLKDRNPNMTKDEAIALVKNRFPEFLPKSILDGRDIMEIFNQPAGAWVKEVKDFVSTLPDGITKEEAAEKVKIQFPQYLSQITTASKKEIPIVACPKHLLNQKKKELKESFEKGECYKAAAIIKDFVNNFGNDEDVLNTVARYLFLIFTVDPTLKDRDVLQHVFTKAESEIYNCTLGCFVFGILLILNTATEDKVIREIGNRVVKLNPDLLSAVLKCLPDDIKKDKIKKEFEKKIGNK